MLCMVQDEQRRNKECILKPMIGVPAGAGRPITKYYFRGRELQAFHVAAMRLPRKRTVSCLHHHRETLRRHRRRHTAAAPPLSSSRRLPPPRDHQTIEVPPLVLGKVSLHAGFRPRVITKLTKYLHSYLAKYHFTQASAPA